MAAPPACRARLAGIIIALLAVTCGGSPDGTPEQTLSGELASYRVVIENETSRVLPRAELWLDVPLAESAEQRRAGLEVSHPYTLRLWRDGNQRIQLEFHDVPVSFRETIAVRVGLEADGGQSQTAHLDPQNYLSSIDVPGIAPLELRATAEELGGADRGATVARTLEWIRQWQPPPAEPSSEPEERAAPPGLEEKWAGVELDSREQAVWLAAALLRANGVPTRVMAGFADSGRGELRADAFELWWEVFLDGRWQTRRMAPEVSRGRVVAMRTVAEPNELGYGAVAESLAEGVGLRVRFQ